MNSFSDILANAPNYQIKHVKKGTLLQSQGEFSNNTYLVKKGLLRSYTIDSKGKEHIFMFAPEGWIISDLESHTTQVPTQLYIDAMEDSEVAVFDWRALDLPHESLKNVQNTLLRRIAVLQRRVLMLMSTPAVDRYEHFLATYPDVANRVPQHMIASYLGITPETLSKIKAERLRKG